MRQCLPDPILVLLTALTVLLVIGFFASTLGTGLGFGESLRTFFFPGEHASAAYQIIWKIRLPRVFLAVVVGAALSIAGASFQAILRNPLAEPYILGISSGGALGAVLSIFLGVELTFLGFSGMTVFAFLGCLVTMLLVYALAFGAGSHLRHIISLGHISSSFARICYLCLSKAVWA